MCKVQCLTTITEQLRMIGRVSSKDRNRPWESKYCCRAKDLHRMDA